MIAHREPTNALISAWLAAALTLTHVLLALAYGRATPYREHGFLLGQRDPATGSYAQVPDIGAPDERQHANYIDHLLTGRGFPVLVWEVPDPSLPGATMRNPELMETYQSHQPPLYYVLAAGFAKVVAADPLSDSGHRIRWLNALLGGGTVLGVYALALWSFRRRGVAVVAAATAALLPMGVALSGAISNDPLLFLLCTWTLAFCVKGACEGWTWTRTLGVGLLIGLALLTKTTAVALAPVALVAFLAFGRRGAGGASKLAAVAAVALLIAAPWFLRNQRLYGDPLALRAFNEAFVASPTPADVVAIDVIASDDGLVRRAQEFAAAHPELKGQQLSRALDSELDLRSKWQPSYWIDWVGWWTARSFVGVFGYMDIFLNERGTSATGPGAPNTLYRVILAALAVSALGCILALRNPDWRRHKAGWWLNALFLFLIALLFVRFNLQYFQGQARYLYPAVGPIACFLAIGLVTMAGNRAKAVAAGTAAALLALNIYALTRLPGEFERRTPQPVTNLLSPLGVPNL